MKSAGALKDSARPTLVSVNGSVIPGRDITQEVQYHPAASAGESWRAAARALVLRELLVQEAHRQCLEANPQIDEQGRRETEEEALIRTLIDNEVRVPTPTDAELRRYYDANVTRFRSQEILEARHILIAALPGDDEARTSARHKADAFAAQLDAAPERFSEMARTYSACTSASEGGSLGQIRPGDTTPEFAAAVGSLREGETTGSPVATRYGFHLIRLDRRIPAKTLPFDVVSQLIADYVTERARRTASAQYLALLVSRAEIVGVELSGTEAHRVH